MGRLAERTGFATMFLMVAALPLIGLGGLRWLGSVEPVEKEQELV